ncbi:cell division cycle 20.2, cofactor of APC complex [Folsomia candida]|uniref:cell division cycle 20.2, cofactor of APC complex n=1 Tax=Folsomia candida TaxID=158441 RepID=UPI000B8FA364|nr:cell division cycle 20.2, cofactor of APC complex [Folsomia candida]
MDLPNGKATSSKSSKRHRNPLDSSSCSLQSINGSFANLSLNRSIKNSHESSKTAKTPVVDKSRLNKSASRSTKTPVADRFVPDRGNFEMAHYLLKKAADEENQNQGDKKGKQKKEASLYSRSLTESMLGVADLSSVRILSYTQKPKAPPEGYQNALKVVYQGSSVVSSNPVVKYRVYPKSPDRVLDAPDIVDDFYLNLLDWSDSNVVAIALKDQVYLWTAHTAEIVRIPCDVAESNMQMVTSVGWMQDGAHLVCALDTGRIQIWDVERTKLLRTLRTDDENERIAALNLNAHLLTQGNRLGTLRNHDLRIAEHEVMTRRGAHSQEVCGVRWSLDGRFCATGGNDNIVNIWDSMNMNNTCQPVCSFSEHQAAIKAICWSPSHSSVLATGGGTNDRCIKLWNISSGMLLKSINAESQVSGLIWSENYREILSSHGFTKNQLALWKYPEMTQVGEMLGHQSRILHMALSPDKTTVATVGADETLRFWRIFPPTKSSADSKKKKVTSQIISGFNALR